MTIYAGLQGAGKSYEATTTVIANALAVGRRVVTNIRGISQIKMHEVIRKKGIAKEGAELGQIVPFTLLDMGKPGFFFDPELLAEKQKKLAALAAEGALDEEPEAVRIDSFVRPGDLFVFDEAWELWGDDKTLPEEHKKFCRMHRHYPDPKTGVTCDIVMLVQNVGSLHRFVRGTIQETYVMLKHEALGKPKAYSVTAYMGCRMRKIDMISQYQRKYDPEWFGVYESHLGGVGKEVKVDKRGTIYTRKFIAMLVFGFLAIAAIPVGIWLAFGDAFTAKSPSMKNVAGVPGLSGGTGPASKSSSSSGSTKVTLVGYVVTDRTMRVIVKTPDGVRFAVPTGATFDGYSTAVTVDGQQVSFLSGAVSGPGQSSAVSSLLPVKK